MKKRINRYSYEQVKEVKCFGDLPEGRPWPEVAVDFPSFYPSRSALLRDLAQYVVKVEPKQEIVLGNVALPLNERDYERVWEGSQVPTFREKVGTQARFSALFGADVWMELPAEMPIEVKKFYY